MKCPYCQLSYGNETSLNQHIRGVHSLLAESGDEGEGGTGEEEEVDSGLINSILNEIAYSREELEKGIIEDIMNGEWPLSQSGKKL